jgi:5-methylcytosine-specific restriction endonuclease McrBC regulatory subunit McrC
MREPSRRGLRAEAKRHWNGADKSLFKSIKPRCKIQDARCKMQIANCIGVERFTQQIIGLLAKTNNHDNKKKCNSQKCIQIIANNCELSQPLTEYTAQMTLVK